MLHRWRIDRRSPNMPSVLGDSDLRAALLIQERRYLMCNAILDGGHDAPFAFSEAIEPLNFLAQALELSSPEIFNRYVCWLASRMNPRDLARGQLISRMDQVSRALSMFLPAIESDCATGYLRAALAAVATPTGRRWMNAPGLGSGEPLSALARAYLDALLAYDKSRAGAIARAAVRDGMSMQALYLEVFQPVLREVGAMWQGMQLGVAQEHFISAATVAIMGQLQPNFTRAPPRPHAVVCACAAGEGHDIGARMLGDLFEAAGWRSIFFGANTPGMDLLHTVIEQRADVLALSCTYAPNLHEISALVEAVRAQPECRGLKVMVGGYAFEGLPALWRKLGADAHATDAAQAVATAEALLRPEPSPAPVD